MLPGWCCIAIAAWSQGTETADATCALSGSISGPESQLKSGFACAGLLCSPRTFEKRKAGFNVIHHDDPYCKYTLQLPSDIQQRAIAQQRFLAASRDPAEAAELHMQEGSVLLRRALTLQDVRKGFKRGMCFTCMLKLASLHTLQALLSPPPKLREGNADAASSVEGLAWPPGEADSLCEAPASVDQSSAFQLDQTSWPERAVSPSLPMRMLLQLRPYCMSGQAVFTGPMSRGSFIDFFVARARYGT